LDPLPYNLVIRFYNRSFRRFWRAISFNVGYDTNISALHILLICFIFEEYSWLT